MASSPVQRSPEAATPFRSAFVPTPAPASLLALTRDAVLVEALRAALDADHRFLIVASDVALGEQLLASQARAVLIDSAACDRPIAQLTERLKAQFPDLVLVVAGSAADQGALAAQITDGRVFRFLHKPVSAQRVKLFVESAFRRSDTMPPPALAPMASPSPARGAARRSSAPYLAGGVALAILAVITIWWVRRDDTAPPAAVRPASNAVREVPVTSSPTASAPATPGPRATGDPDGEVDRLLGEAEKAIVAERLDDAARLIDRARAVRAEHPRVAFLAAQLGKERERQLLAAARQAAAAGQLERAISMLESSPAAGSELLGAARRELQQQEIESQAAGFLALADARVKAGALLEPAEDNARFYIESARALAPQHAALPLAERALQSALAGAARRAIDSGDLPAADQRIAEAEANGVDHAILTSLRRELEQVRIEQSAAAFATLSREFEDRVRERRLLEPQADSARAIYFRMREADPQNPITLAARDTLGDRFLAESQAALARADLPRAERWVAEAEALGLSGLAITNARRDIATVRARTERATEVVNASQLTRVRMVEPRYPADAQAGGQEGWVDLEFTVTPAGAVSEVKVVKASPAGVFDEAAVDAIARWRFKPVERNGVAIPQRARLRIRFDLQ